MTANEYATIVYYWHGDPQDGRGKGTQGDTPDRRDELLYFLQDRGWGRDMQRDIASAGVVLALELRYPDDRPTWRADHKPLYDAIERTILNWEGRQEWAAFYIAKWFITHDLQNVDAILDMIADGGEGAFFARQALNQWQEKCIPFRYAVKAAQKARHEAMLIQVPQ